MHWRARQRRASRRATPASSVELACAVTGGVCLATRNLSLSSDRFLTTSRPRWCTIAPQESGRTRCVTQPVRLLTVLFLLSSTGWGQVIPKLSPVFTYLCSNDFQTCPNGFNPVSSPLQIGKASFFYAVSFNGGQGGANAGGTIVRTNVTGLGGAVYTFQPGPQNDFPNGQHPGVAFISGPDGNFYGITQKGGSHNWGVMFRLSPSGTVQKVRDFCSLSNCVDAGAPLTLAKDGNFYGLASKIFFRISIQGVWTQIATLPVNLGLTTQLIQANDGNFYGANYIQNDGNGVAFRISPSGQYSELHSSTPTLFLPAR